MQARQQSRASYSRDDDGEVTTRDADLGRTSGGDVAQDNVKVSREDLIDALETTGWVQAKAARLLKLTPRQIGYAIRKYDIPVKRL